MISEVLSGVLPYFTFNMQDKQDKKDKKDKESQVSKEEEIENNKYRTVVKKMLEDEKDEKDEKQTFDVDDIPLWCRWIEGLSTGSMFVSIAKYWNQFPLLVMTYILHWPASIFFHLKNSKLSYDCDTTLIDVMINERIAMTHPLLGPPLIYLSSIFINVYFSSTFPNHLFLCLKTVVGTLFYIFLNSNKPQVYTYASSFLYLFASYLLSTFFIKTKSRLRNVYVSSLFCILYHYFLGPYSASEFHFYLSSSSSDYSWIGVLRFMSWLSYGFHFIVRQLETTEKYRIQSVMSLMAASVLAPVGLLEAAFFFAGKDMESVFGHRLQVHFFYIAYGIMDTLYGNLYYPDFFPLLEGWAHHVLTSMFTLYNLYNGYLRPCSISMIVEVPSVVLFSSRVFKDNEVIRKLRQEVFPHIFVIFRIILLSVMGMDCYRKGDGDISVLFVLFLFSTLNIYWISIIFIKKSSKSKKN